MGFDFKDFPGKRIQVRHFIIAAGSDVQSAAKNVRQMDNGSLQREGAGGFRVMMMTDNADQFGRQVPALVAVMAMATVAFVAVGTLLSSMVVRTRFAEFMLPILLLPFLIPPIVGAVQLTSRVLAARPLSDLSGWLKLLASFDIIFVVLCFLLFEATLEE